MEGILIKVTGGAILKGLALGPGKDDGSHALETPTALRIKHVAAVIDTRVSKNKVALFVEPQHKFLANPYIKIKLFWASNLILK